MPQNLTCKLRKRFGKCKGTSLLLTDKSMRLCNLPIFCHSNQYLHHDRAAVYDVVYVTVARPQLKRSEAFVAITGDFTMFTWTPLVSCFYLLSPGPLVAWTDSSMKKASIQNCWQKSVKSVVKVRLEECELPYIRDEQRGMKTITEFNITDHQQRGQPEQKQWSEASAAPPPRPSPLHTRSETKSTHLHTLSDTLSTPGPTHTCWEPTNFNFHRNDHAPIVVAAKKTLKSHVRKVQLLLLCPKLHITVDDVVIHLLQRCEDHVLSPLTLTLFNHTYWTSVCPSVIKSFKTKVSAQHLGLILSCIALYSSFNKKKSSVIIWHDY